MMKITDRMAQQRIECVVRLYFEGYSVADAIAIVKGEVREELRNIVKNYGKAVGGYGEEESTSTTAANTTN